MTRQQAEAIRRAMDSAGACLTDDEAANAVALYKPWKPGEVLTADERRQHNGKVYRVLQNHTTQQDWAPDAAPSLFAVILPGQGGTQIGVWVQPDSTNPYMEGDAVLYDGRVWVSDVNNNVWEPGVYGWHVDA